MSNEQIRNSADKIDGGVAAVAASVSNSVDSLNEKRHELQDKAREFGRGLLDDAKELTDEVTKQAHLRPLAVFGVAFVAGVVVARLLRR
ncbi:MAG: hypothetical protein ABI304_03545 [Rudaea sp.]